MGLFASVFGHAEHLRTALHDPPRGCRTATATSEQDRVVQYFLNLPDVDNYWAQRSTMSGAQDGFIAS